MSKITGRRRRHAGHPGSEHLPQRGGAGAAREGTLSPDYLLVVDERGSAPELLALCEYRAAAGPAPAAWRRGCARCWGSGSGSACCPRVACRGPRWVRRSGSCGGRLVSRRRLAWFDLDGLAGLIWAGRNAGAGGAIGGARLAARLVRTRVNG